ncbi:MAG: amidase [Defluviicoccus sp.]|nr:amidase [Defluviicoccus sp.]
MTAELPTIAAAARGYRDGTLSPVDVTALCLERIERYDGALHCYHAVFAEEAMAAARAAEQALGRGEDLGPLHGIPVALKDVFYWKGRKTTSNSRVMLHFEADEDAGAIDRLKQGGAVLLGQLNTYEFTFGGRPSTEPPFPPALNPWDTGRITGGSSSGSGAAVAAGLCLGALGTDAGGSIRLPAAFCGIAGLKPTIGRVSAFGDMPLTYSFDCVGPMAWTSEDAAIMLQALAGYDARDPMSADVAVPDYLAGLEDGVAGLRVGLIRHFYTDDFASPPEIVRAIDGVAETLAGLGAEIEEVSVSPLIDWHAVGRVLVPAEAFAIHEERLQTSWEEYGRLARNRLMLGSLFRAVDYIQAQRRRTELLAELEAVLAGCDVVVTTGMMTPAPPLDDTEPFPFIDVPTIGIPFNLTAHPCHVVRAGFFADGTPIGAQIAARHWDEATVLRTAHAFERAACLNDRRPPLDG